MLPPLPDVDVLIRHFLLSHAGHYCEACLAEGTGLDAKAVHAAFYPSRNNPYSFMPERCHQCERTALCVAWVGEPEATGVSQAASAVMGAKH